VKRSWCDRREIVHMSQRFFAESYEISWRTRREFVEKSGNGRRVPHAGLCGRLSLMILMTPVFKLPFFLRLANYSVIGVVAVMSPSGHRGS